MKAQTALKKIIITITTKTITLIIDVLSLFVLFHHVLKRIMLIVYYALILCIAKYVFRHKQVHYAIHPSKFHK